jgi:drug/metabolite transporter (DMT)-like permease
VLFDRTNLLLAMATGVTLAGAALLLVYSISQVGAGSAAVYAGLAPLFAVPLGVLIFKERMSLIAVIGCLLAIAGIICVSMG